MVLILQFVFVYLDDLVGKGIGAGVYFELIFYAFLEAIPMALPLAILLSSIMAMGNLAERNELTAMKSAGISLFRVMRPLLLVMVIIGGISFYFSNNVWGKAHLKKKISKDHLKYIESSIRQFIDILKMPTLILL